MAEDQVKDLFGDSDSDAEPQQPAGEGLEDSDAELPQQDARQTAANLFGSSDEEDEAPGPSHPVTQALGDDEDEYRRSPSPAATRGPPLLVEAEPCDVPPQDSLRLVKLPNILGVEPRPFDPDTFDAGAQVEIDARGFKRVRLRDQNCIRWRWAADEASGGQVQESNARFVRWSDGSLQLLLGDEVLDVKEIDTTNEHTYMYARLPSLIQGQGQLARKMVFQPASLQSNLHKQLRAAADKLHVKKQRVRATTTLVDPKKVKAEQERAEAEAIKGRERLADKQSKAMRKFSMPRSRMPQQLNADYLEEDEDLDEEGMAEDMQDVQRQRMLGGRGRAAYDEDEDEERAARLAAAKAGGGAVPGGKRRRIEEEEDEDEEEEISGAEEDDEDEEEGAEEMKGFIVDEEEEGAGGGGAGGAAAAVEAAPAPSKQQQQQPAVKQRRQVVLSDSEED